MMKTKLMTLFMLIPILATSLFQLPTITHASELNFAVEAVIPENQRDKTKTYFDLRMEPSTEQTIEVNLRNDTDADVTVEPSVNTATTNLNGVVEYGVTKAKKDSTLPVNLTDIVTVQKEVTIPANDSVKVPLTIKMPATKFDGVLAGGITIKEKDVATDKKESDSQGLAINNKYAYVVALILNQTDKEVAPKLVLNDVKPAQVNARNVINANLQNTQAAYVNALDVVAKVTKKGSSEVLYESSKKNMQMAPNSNFNYPISLNGQKLEAGDYTLSLKADAKEGNWSFTKNFTIKAEDAKKYNQADVSIKKDNTWIYLVIGLLLLVIVALIIFFLIRNKKKKKEEEERRKKAARLRKRKAQRKKQANEIKKNKE